MADVQALDLEDVHENLPTLQAAIVVMHAKSFPTYTIINEILKEDVKDLWGRGKGKVTEKADDERFMKKRKRSKKSDTEVAKAAIVDSI